MSELYPSDNERQESAEAVRLRVIQTLEVLIEQARITLDTYQRANAALDSKAWQLIALTAAILAVVIPNILGSILKAYEAQDSPILTVVIPNLLDSIWSTKPQQTVIDWIVLWIAICVTGGATIISCLDQALLRREMAVDFDMHKMDARELLIESTVGKKYDQFLRELLSSYVGPVKNPNSSTEPIQSPIAAAKQDNENKLNRLKEALGWFITMILLITVGSLICFLFF